MRLSRRSTSASIFMMVGIFTACGQVDRDEPKSFPLQAYHFGERAERLLNLAAVLSYKADGQVYYKIEASSSDTVLLPVLQGKSAAHLYILFEDANSLILKELAPSWNINDRRDVMDDQVIWRGSFEMPREMFDEIAGITPEFK
jgi:hypothetical protein